MLRPSKVNGSYTPYIRLLGRFDAIQQLSELPYPKDGGFLLLRLLCDLRRCRFPLGVIDSIHFADG
jgi:hypothetical protein